MLRHFKMELLKRQQEELLASEKSNTTTSAAMPTSLISDQQISAVISAQPLKQQQSKAESPAPARKGSAAATQRGSRNRRASKPQMEKRRRARINECLDILKSYVLTDSTNLTHLGIDLSASENQDEETIARTILKSSGLIYRHRGRKNPNKLEKADILELTVDYVRRLHDQRNELLISNSVMANGHEHNRVMNLTTHTHGDGENHQSGQLVVVPSHLTLPLTLDLSPKSRLNNQQEANDLLAPSQHHGTPLTPPPSSASSMQSNNDEQTNVAHQMLVSRTIDNYKLYDMLQSC